ncbi:MAG: sulfatase [Marinilabiliaceae bacterium]
MKTLIPATAILSGLISCTFAGDQAETQSPNIVLINLDDMGYGDLTLTGAADYDTPHLDKMASGGVVFTHFYTPQAVCSASRAGLLTGCYPNRIGFHGALDHTAEVGLNPDETTIAEMLKEEGYATATYGKWHLGHHEKFLPLQHGFDDYHGIPYSNDMWPEHPQAGDYYPPLPLFEDNEVIETNPDQRFFTRDFTQRTIEFIKKNQDQPFFVYLAHPMPHVPLFTSPAFRDTSKQGKYGDVMMELDNSVGQINQTIEELDLEVNTLVIFMSDNGPWLNYGNRAGTTGGLREGKGTTFEGGQRVPCIMKWDGTIEGGRISNGLTSAIDILPTLAGITGADLPEKKIDGVDISELMTGEIDDSPRETFLYYYRQNNLQAVRKGKWKLVFQHRGRTYEGFAPGNDGMPGKVDEHHPFEKGLYNLRRDPGERYNVLEDYPEIVAELEDVAEKARRDLGDDLTGAEGENRRSIGRVK